MEALLPKYIDIYQIFFFVEQIKEQCEIKAKFWKGKDIPGDEIETVFARTSDTDTILGTIDVADELEKLASWLRSLTEASD